MRVVQRLGLIVLLSSLLAAQSGPPADSDSAKIQKLLDAMAAQQKAMADQQQQIQQQQQEIEQLKKQIPQAQQVSSSSDAQLGQVVNASLTVANPAPAARAVSDVADQETERKESPLSFRIGGAEFTPGGFMDFTAIFRSVNTGNLGTNFFNIPFSNSVQGHLTENRFTAQNSRVSLKATDKFGRNDVTGYVEMDFLGNDGGNVFVTSNSHTLRQRLYWVQVKRDKFEILAGQSWGWLTPNRTGLSPLPPDVFYSQNMDFNYQVGLTWTRAPQVRFVYHPNDNLAFGVALENPEQFAGQANMVAFPSVFNAQITAGNPQLDQAGASTTPNLHPDVIPKIAYDTTMGGKHFHVEAAGLLTTKKIAILPTAPGSTFVSHTKTGGGAMAAINLEVIKNVRIVANGFYSDGGGRYIFGMAPDAVVLPTGTTGAFDAQLSLVHSGSGIFGFEAQVTPKTMIYGYYGGVYVQRNFACDITAPGAGPCNGKPAIGYGGPNEAGATFQNRAIQEPTVGWIQTFWKNPQYGALQLITQASYLTRAPWFVAAGAPKNAHLAMGWVDLRYVLP